MVMEAAGWAVEEEEMAVAATEAAAMEEVAMAAAAAAGVAVMDTVVVAKARAALGLAVVEERALVMGAGWLSAAGASRSAHRWRSSFLQVLMDAAPAVNKWCWSWPCRSLSTLRRPSCLSLLRWRTQSPTARGCGARPSACDV